jgi:NAD(P)-dependent dehydrogenase (short-subunit alcohol dehydrogenase family)
MSSKIALITGAYRGLGQETARQLLKKGYDVIMTARKAGAGEKAAEALARETGRKTWFVALDVTNSVSIETAAREVSGLVDHLDLLINNAAIFPDPSKSALDTPPEMVADAFKTNSIGPLLVSRALLPLLKKTKPGPARIVNISSGLGALGYMQNSCTAYSLSKTALNAVTRQLAAAMIGDRVLVNSVCPGWCRTEMGGTNAPRSPEEGASGIVWLATEAPTDATGKFWRDGREIAW